MVSNQLFFYTILYSAARWSLKSEFLSLFWLWHYGIFLLPPGLKLWVQLSGSSNIYRIPSPNRISSDFPKCNIKWFWPSRPLHQYPPAFMLLQILLLFLTSLLCILYSSFNSSWSWTFSIKWSLIIAFPSFSSILIFKLLSYPIYVIPYQLF